MSIDVAVIPGDGIGKEVMEQGLKVLEAVEEMENVKFKFSEFPWGCEYYLKNNEMMPHDGLKQLSAFDSILMGAVGYPGVPDHVSLWGLLLPIRRGFDQYINLRPSRLLRGFISPLADKKPGSFNFDIVRENTEGEYSNMGGILREGTNEEIAVQNSIFTHKGTERVIRYAFKLAIERSRISGKTPYVAGATKSNGINYTMPFWDRIFRGVASEFPEVRTNLFHIDALAAYLVTKPETFDVIVGSNLFGDILSDIGGAISGGIGVSPSANLNPEGKYPSLFEPVHGSAPDIAGKGIANPVGMIWTVAMFLEHHNMGELSKALLEAIQRASETGFRTPDLKGKYTTAEVSSKIIEIFREIRS
ncbi:MAG: tartrate dehydrogenase [Candidatus Thermoplasmatota archaeon]|nr:tartrate dehydrogenase [Candidatus Thermoplasmatota archaeon]